MAAGRQGEDTDFPFFLLRCHIKEQGDVKMKQDMIVILDLGSTENTVVARAIRDMGVYSEIHPHDITVDGLKALDNVKGII